MKVQLSKTKIKKNLKRKTHPRTVETIKLAKEQKAWLPIAKIISGPTRNYTVLNLEEINEQASAGDVVVLPGKVLGVGELIKKVKVCALAFTSSAIEKMNKAKIEYCYILDEIKKNPDAKGVKVLR